ncbi:MAG TPA: MBL fold metallo-hydrolase, partial [bacterium]|nr:MBL fold metallo-hydrolase [bacterium]
MGSDFRIKRFAAGSCCSYVLSSGGEAIVVDPHISLLEEYEVYLGRKKLSLNAIVDTHTHADHFSLAAVMKEKFNVPVMMHEKAISEVADRSMRDGDTLKVGDAELKIIYTPGHTDDAISIFGEGAILTGDVLLIGSVGRTDFQNGSPESMFETLSRLRELPDETTVYPGHDYHGKIKSTIAREKKNNPFLSETDRAAFLTRARAKELPKPFNIDNIIRVNRRGEAAAMQTISPREARVMVDSHPDVKLIDVRSESEFGEEHIEGSLNVPIDSITSRVSELGCTGAGYVVLCRTGNRSPMAADMLVQAGVPCVKIMRGGITAWRKEGFEVVKGEGRLSVERQIRTIAGALVLLGVLLAAFVHPAFIALSGLV